MKVKNSKQFNWLALGGTVCSILIILTAFFILQGSDPDSAARDACAGSGVIITPPSAAQVPLDPLTIPKFAQELTVPPVIVPTVVKDYRGKVIRHEVGLTVDYSREQVLPPPFPKTTVLAYGSKVKFPGSSVTQFAFSSPGPTFDNPRGIPLRLTYCNAIKQQQLLPVDPTLHWANPNAIEMPEFPFEPFPPGYPAAQFPVAHVTHIHGLVVAPQFDGTAEEWFTAFGQRGPAFVSKVYEIPNDQPSTQLFYHDHTMGITRLGMYMGIVGPAYLIRDPDSPLDKPSSPLPKGKYEVILGVHDRQFFTDGEFAFPRTSTNPTATAYWQPGDGANTVLVNGKVWPNLNVERKQYRFRIVAIGNGRTWTFQFTNGGTPIDFTVIGSDGGYLPAPLVVQQVILGITERADVLVDFSQYAPGTQIIMINAGANPDTVGTVMRFTVQDTPAVTPPSLPAALFPARPALPTDAPLKLKSMHNHVDAEGNAMRSVDGLMFTSPGTEFSLVGSTEQWDMVNVGGGGHQMHLHLIEFQVLNRQAVNSAAYNNRWMLLNGFRPISRPITVDPAPFFTGDPIPPEPVETGWKDTARAPSGFVTRIIARWAPQEIPTGGVAPGQNKFPIDPEFPPEVDPYTETGYVWHCHILSHEDHDMMRKLAIVDAWKGGVRYPLGKVIAYQDINYRARKAHTSSSTQPPNTRFELWERVNNNDGTWQPQIIYAIGDRVLFNEQLYRALHVHQAQPGQTPAVRTDLWEPLPMTACEQLVFFTQHHLGTDPRAQEFFDIGQAGDEAACTAALPAALAIFDHMHAMPCSGVCENPFAFAVPDGTTFTSDPDVTCYETNSQLLKIIVPRLLSGQKVLVNGRELKAGVNYPLPSQRNHGYCIQTVGGAVFIADSGGTAGSDCTCSAGCEARTSISVPFTKNGAGEFCWEATNLGTYINSWELVTLNINGNDYTNRYVLTSEIPKINGKYYIYYKGAFAWSHLQIRH